MKVAVRSDKGNLQPTVLVLPHATLSWLLHEPANGTHDENPPLGRGVWYDVLRTLSVPTMNNCSRPSRFCPIAMLSWLLHEPPKENQGENPSPARGVWYDV